MLLGRPCINRKKEEEKDLRIFYRPVKFVRFKAYIDLNSVTLMF